MFCVISTALVLQGVIIVDLGPTKEPFITFSLSKGASPKSHCSFVVFSGLSVVVV